VPYPSKDDYLKAVQHGESFTTDELRRAEFVPHPVWRIPKPAAGSSAVVFKAVLDGQEQALRFLTREDASRRDRYEALQDHFAGHDLAGCVALSRWVDDAILVNGRSWPVVLMQWVNGRTLNQYVDHLVEQHDVHALARLAATWRDLVVRLQGAEFAHGDLQHGNVLVDERGVLRLVDFDCSWIGTFSGQHPPAETGHRNYQPANRPWGRWMDTFSGLVVYLSLLTLSRNPTPWHALNTGENLLFQRDDFRPPFESPAWVHLSSIRDPELDEVAARLKECCAPGWSATGGLSELLTRRALPWWELVGGTEPDPTCADPATGVRTIRTPEPTSVPRQVPASAPPPGPLPPPPPLPPPVVARPPAWPPPGQRRPDQPTGQWWDGATAAPGPAAAAPGTAGDGRPSRRAAIRAGLATGAFTALVGAVASGVPAAGVALGVLAGLVVAGLFLLVRASAR
jgi:hypothetical protein